MLEILILSNLMLKPCYGYELKRKLQLLNPNNNKLYPLLRCYADDGLVISRTENQDGKPARKVYEITEAGRKRFIELLSDFSQKDANVNDEFYIRVAFFSLLEKPVVETILNRREASLRARSETLHFSDQLNQYPDPCFDILFLQNYLSASTQLELRFLDNLRKKNNIAPSSQDRQA